MRQREDEEALEYSRAVGELLRGVRKQKKLSLNDVEVESQNEFKASVVGAYERGERSLSLIRLGRLAEFYNVPMEHLLPRDITSSRAFAPAGSGTRKLPINVEKLSTMRGLPFETLLRFLRMIQMQRQDFNGRVITVRGDDARAIAAILDVPADQVADRLRELDLLFN